ncbi:MAG: hypothetical protein AAF581_06000 [Planctomycetota bacterium]
MSFARPLSFGESYAGHYIPELATEILDNAATDSPIPLRGIGLGNAWVNPLVQQEFDADYAYAHGLIGLNEKQKADGYYADIVAAFARDPEEADSKSTVLINYIEAISQHFNPYDIRATQGYDYDPLIRYLRRDDVKSSLHVDPAAVPWATRSSAIAANLKSNIQASRAELFPRLLANMRVLIYNGIYDMDCNFMGTDAWLSQIEWPRQRQFNECQRLPWMDDKMKKLFGHLRLAGNLTQLLVLDAGHLVPMDQPEAALRLIEHFMADDFRDRYNKMAVKKHVPTIDD